MPNLTRSLILIAFGGSLLLLAVRRLRQYKLKERYALLFLAAGLPFVFLALWPNLIVWVSDVLHISINTVMLLCVSVFLFFIMIELFSIISQQDRKITTLAQMVAILMERQNLTDRPDAPTRDGAAPAEPVLPKQNDR